MEIRTLNFEHLLRVKKLPIIKSSKKGDPDGLFSKEIFGLSNEEHIDYRREGLINLNCKILHPNIVDQFNTIDREIYFCLTTTDGSKYGMLREEKRIKRIPNNLIDDTEQLDKLYSDIGKGPDFIYKHWDAIKVRFKNKTDAAVDNQMLYKSIYTSEREEIFYSYYVVPCMAIRLEEEISTGLVTNEINKFYVSMIDISNLLESYISSGTLPEELVDLQIRLQKTALELIRHLIDTKMGPKGEFKTKLLAKTIDNSSRLTITTAAYNKDLIGASKVNTRALGIPLQHSISNFRPVYLKFIRDILDVLDSAGVLIPNTRIHYTTEYIESLMSKMPDDTFKVTYFKLLDITGKASDECLFFYFLNKDTNEYEKRNVTYIEFFYIISSKYFADIENKFMIINTRFPIAITTSTQCHSPIILTLVPSFIKDESVSIKLFEHDTEREFDEFPTITDEIKNFVLLGKTMFDSGIRTPATVTVALEGDHDGDASSQNPLLSVEAVKEAKEVSTSLANAFSISGSYLRGIGRDPAQAMWSLTRNIIEGKDRSTNGTNSEIVSYLLNRANDTQLVSMNYIIEHLFSSDSKNSIYDKIRVTINNETIDTTTGRLLFNVICFRPILKNKYFRFMNETINGKKFKTFMEHMRQLVIENKITLEELWYIIDKHAELCMRLSTIVNASITTNMLVPSKEFTDFKNKAIKEINDDYKLNNMYDYELIAKKEKEIIEFTRNYFKNDDMYELYLSENKLSLDNDFKNINIWQGVLPNILGGDPIVSLNSLNGEPDFATLPMQYNIAIKGAVDRGVNTQIGGYMNKLLTDGLKSIVAKRDDCGATIGSSGIFTKSNEILNRYIIEKNGSLTLVTSENVHKYLNREINYRDINACQMEEGHFCSTCTGIGIFSGISPKTQTVALGILANEPSSKLMNLSMKSTHSIGVDLFKIRDLNSFVYPAGSKLFKHVEVDGKIEIQCVKNLKLLISNSVIEPVDTLYKTLLYGTVLVNEDTGEEYTLLLGSEVLTSPREIDKDMSGLTSEEMDLTDVSYKEVTGHSVFHYRKNDKFIESDVTFKLGEVSSKMFLLYLTGKVSSLIPLDLHIEILNNTFKHNAELGTSDLILKVIIYTLARSAKNFRIPARLRRDEKYRFISILDHIAIAGTMTRTMAGYGSKGLVISMGETTKEQTRNMCPMEKSFRG